MQNPPDTSPRRGRDAPLRTRARGVMATLVVQFAAIGAGIALAGSVLLDDRPARATAPASPWFGKRIALLEQRLAAKPDDQLTRIRLAECLTSMTVIQAQQSFQDGEPGSDPNSEQYRAHVAETVRSSPNASIAIDAARRVLAASKDPELRFRACKTLGVTQYYLLNTPAQARFLRAAYREHPCRRCRDLLATVEYRVGQEWGIE